MTHEAFVPVLIQILLALAIAGGLISVSHIFGQRIRNKSKLKDTPYECGVESIGSPHPRFSVKFYVVAMLFIIFDIEVVFLFPWVLVYRDFLKAGIPILLPVLFFLTVLVVGLFYELKKGALEWER